MGERAGGEGGIGLVEAVVGYRLSVIGYRLSEGPRVAEVIREGGRPAGDVGGVRGSMEDRMTWHRIVGATVGGR